MQPAFQLSPRRPVTCLSTAWIACQKGSAHKRGTCNAVLLSMQQCVDLICCHRTSHMQLHPHAAGHMASMPRAFTPKPQPTPAPNATPLNGTEAGATHCNGVPTRFPSIPNFGQQGMALAPTHLPPCPPVRTLRPGQGTHGNLVRIPLVVHSSLPCHTHQQALGPSSIVKVAAVSGPKDLKDGSAVREALDSCGVVVCAATCPQVGCGGGCFPSICRMPM